MEGSQVHQTKGSFWFLSVSLWYNGRMEDPVKKRARDLKYYYQHRKELAQKKVIRRLADPEKAREQSRQTYKRRKDKHQVKSLAWRRANPDRVKLYNKINRIRARRIVVKDIELKIRQKPIRLHKVTKREVKEWREKKLRELSQKTIQEIITDPELIRLIEEQEKDDKRFMIKYDFSFATVEH